MDLIFEKYHGAGNDFILINGFESQPDLSQEQVYSLCKRHTGIGADGLIIIKPSEEADFYMDYYNADGKLGSLCGNGSRCAVQFAYAKGIIEESCEFLASDGKHSASVLEGGRVDLKMAPVKEWEEHFDDLVIDTGSPHYIKEVYRLEKINVISEGRKIRCSETYQNHGINVNFVEENDSGFSMRTYERGVENETQACGTGAVATALALNIWGRAESPISVQAPGGLLEISFEKNEKGFHNIHLIGPAERVYSGKVRIQ